ncbi:hypothetical protein GIB67_034502 [Kingdonia uniflora]|uniref:Kinesin motor domain-containing protein n=1 Tax=Kingdonia uniflora TaxID=39325 RepID=A0A7J7PBD2_9MAGN|nr:hypothetical protein GIB67_034502 [Kingdonia uniflora]
MLVSVDEEELSLPLENIREAMGSAEGLDPDSLDGLPMLSELPPTTASYTDVNVVPEHDKKALEETIFNFKGEISGLRSKQRSLDEKRREALNSILDLKGSIRVFCRVRPFLSSDRKRIREPISTGSEKVLVRLAGSRKEFSLDKILAQEATQEDVFVEVEPILRSALDGHNICILAYGQTGTGKTFTMEGKRDRLGIVPRALKEIFCQASQDSSVSFTFSMSMLEVYMGSLRDLLTPKPSGRTYETAAKSNLNIQTHRNGFVEVEGLTDLNVSDFTQASRLYTKGRHARSTSWTNVNEASSRSHCLTRINIGRSGEAIKGKVEVSKLWMVDLGGSERLLKTGATGQTLDEGKAINLSLSALGDVIAALKRKRGHVPYRQVLAWCWALSFNFSLSLIILNAEIKSVMIIANSKLTQILQDTLGDGSKALMLVHISPCEEDVGETICTLNFAQRVRAVESNRELSEELKKHKEKKISELDRQRKDAEEEWQKMRGQIQKTEILLHEKQKLFSSTYQLFDDPNDITVGPQEDCREVIGTPRKAETAMRKNNCNSLPRFMTSTAASRHRQSPADVEIIPSRARFLRLDTRSSFQFSGSQSLSYSEPNFRTVLRSSNRISRYAEHNTPPVTDNPKCNGSDTRIPSTPRNKRVTPSQPNLRGTLSRHRRRMSDLV